MHAQFTKEIYVMPVVQLYVNFGKKKIKSSDNLIQMIPAQREFKPVA